MISTDPITKHPNTNRLYRVGFGAELPAGVTITLVTATLQSPASGLTVGAAAIGTTQIVDDHGVTHAVGRWISVRLSGGTASVDYEVRIDATSSDADMAPLSVVVPVRVRNS